ncbi:MAG: hypothetical protein IKE91_05990 [Clostridia bacterium]|nr:hypothetical protein [Clostridia bacterium]
MKKTKENLLSKNNYDIQFEELLEQKQYTDEAKSLILNIIYKIQGAYPDYKRTKPNVKSKLDIISDIADTIKDKCDTIEVLNPTETKGKLYVSKKNKIIKTFPKDIDLLQAIYYIKTPYTKRIENVFEKAVLLALEKGMAINGVEIIRDFNGWSWNNVLEDEFEKYYNLLYQDLIILIGEGELESVIKSHNVIEELLKKLKYLYGKTKAEEFVQIFVKACVVIYMNNGEKYEDDVLEYLNKKEEELSEFSNKSQYISRLNDKMNENTKLGCKIDALLSSPRLLSKKYSTKKISEKYKDIDSYRISLIKYKNQISNEITSCRKMMNPFEYVKVKNSIKKDVDDLNEIKLCYNDDGIIEKLLIDLQKKVISCFYKKIEVYDLKKELISLVYEIRYYNLLPLGNKELKDIKSLKNDIEKMQIEFVNKLKKNRVLDIYSNFARINYYTFKYIFEARMVNINKISFKYKIVNNGIDIEYYDEESVEQKIHLALNKEELQGFTKKENRKIKIFL